MTNITDESKRPLEASLRLRSSIISMDGHDAERLAMLPLVDAAIGILFDVAAGLDMAGGAASVQGAAFAPVAPKDVTVRTREDLGRLAWLIADSETPSEAYESFVDGAGTARPSAA